MRRENRKFKKLQYNKTTGEWCGTEFYFHPFAAYRDLWLSFMALKKVPEFTEVKGLQESKFLQSCKDVGLVVCKCKFEGFPFKLLRLHGLWLFGKENGMAQLATHFWAMPLGKGELGLAGLAGCDIDFNQNVLFTLGQEGKKSQSHWFSKESGIKRNKDRIDRAQNTKTLPHHVYTPLEMCVLICAQAL